MRTRTAVLLLVVVTILSISIHAVMPRAAIADVNLTFSGTTANCSVIVCADNEDDVISGTIYLKRGSSTVASWPVNEKGMLIFDETATVTKGKTYTLSANLFVNGVAISTAPVTATCSKFVIKWRNS